MSFTPDMSPVVTTEQYKKSISLEKPKTSQLTIAEKHLLKDEIPRFAASDNGNKLSPLGDLLRHLGTRWAKRQENITDIGEETQRIFIPEGHRYLQVSLVDINETQDEPGQSHFESSDPFTSFVIHNAYISEVSLKTLMIYQKNGGKLVLMRSERPTEEFMKALSIHAKTYNGGISLLTQADVLMDGLSKEHEAMFEQDEELPLTNSEDQSLHGLVRLANNGSAIHFSAITPDQSLDGTEQVSQEVTQALSEVNAAIDPYEFVYWTISSLSETQRRDQVTALALLGAGVVMPEILKNFVAPLGAGAEMATASITGDVIAGFMTGRGQMKNGKLRKTVTAFVENAKEYMSHFRENIKEDKLLQHRLFAGACVAGITAAAIGLTIATGGALILPFLLASPLNSTIIMGTELHKRIVTNPKTPEEIREVMSAYMEGKSTINRKFVELFPKTALAWYDMVRNPTAMGAWAGTGASAPILMALTTFLPTHIPLPVVIAASTLIIENVGAASAGASNVFRDPWKNYERALPQVQHLIDAGKKEK